MKRLIYIFKYFYFYHTIWFTLNCVAVFLYFWVSEQICPTLSDLRLTLTLDYEVNTLKFFIFNCMCESELKIYLLEKFLEPLQYTVRSIQIL